MKKNEEKKKFLVTGKVQGVGYRYYTKEIALNLRLKGYVKNLYSGEVEVLAIGPPDMIKELLGYLKRGPAMANVENVSVLEDSSKVEYSTFDISF